MPMKSSNVTLGCCQFTELEPGNYSLATRDGFTELYCSYCPISSLLDLLINYCINQEVHGTMSLYTTDVRTTSETRVNTSVS